MSECFGIMSIPPSASIVSWAVVGFHTKKRSTFEEFYAKPKKRSTFVGFHAKKRSTFEEFYAKPKKKVHFCRISR